MKVKNKLKHILEQMGIKSMIPTDALLKKLGGMTLIRFNKIVNNSPSMEALTAMEADYLKKWVAAMTNQSVADIELFEVESVQEGAMS
jgi:hypothetical protein